METVPPERESWDKATPIPYPEVQWVTAITQEFLVYLAVVRFGFLLNVEDRH